MKGYKHNIEMINETEEDELYNEYQNDIKEYMIDMMDSCFDFDIDLLVVFRQLDKKVNHTTNETDAGHMTYKDGRYIIVLNINSLKLINEDNGLDIATSMYHELTHVYDLYHTMNNKYYIIDPLKCKFKTFEDFIISKGWRFWTEYYAYFLMFKKFRHLHRCPTFLQLVKGYERLEKLHQELYPHIEDGSKETQCQAENFIDQIYDLVYAVAKYLAGSIWSKNRNYDYCEKTSSKKSFKIMSKFCDGAIRRIIPLFTNTYGKGMARKLLDLGDFIVKNIFGNFNIYPTRYKKKIVFAFFC